MNASAVRDALVSLVTRSLARLFLKKRPPEHSAFDSILILKPCCLGDVLMATPVIAALRRAYPLAQIDFATGSWSRPVVVAHPELRGVVNTGRVGQGAYGWLDVWNLARQLRAAHYDLCLTLDRSPRVGLVAWLARIPYRAGLDSGGRGFAHNIRVPVPPIRYEPELYLDVPRAVFPQTPRSKFEFVPEQFFPTENDKAFIVSLLDKGCPSTPSARGGTADSSLIWIALHPGGGANPGTVLSSKRWPPDRFAAIADSLVEQYGAKVFLVGGPSDAAVTNAVRTAMRHGGDNALVDLTGQLTFGQLGALYQRCVLMIGNDSGVMHLANACGTPVVALYGPSDPRVYGPYDARSLALWHQVGCNPCFQNGRARPDCCPNHAIEAIDTEECWQAVEIVLRRQGVAKPRAEAYADIEPY
jgi:ADP-heptose:LPS heptosyltransferase